MATRIVLVNGEVIDLQDVQPQDIIGGLRGAQAVSDGFLKIDTPEGELHYVNPAHVAHVYAVES